MVMTQDKVADASKTLVQTSMRIRRDLLVAVQERQLEHKRRGEKITLQDVVEEAVEMWLTGERVQNLLLVSGGTITIQELGKIPQVWLAAIVELAEETNQEPHLVDTYTRIITALPTGAAKAREGSKRKAGAPKSARGGGDTPHEEPNGRTGSD